MNRCLETRTTAVGWTRRRYRTPDGHVITTLEMPDAVARALGTGRLRAAMDTWKRGEQRRARAAAVRAHVLATLDQPASSVADALGVTPQRVRQIRKTFGDPTSGPRSTGEPGNHGRTEAVD
jgi:hypothetical protein